MKYIFLLFVIVFFSCEVSAQIKDTVKTSTRVPKTYYEVTNTIVITVKDTAYTSLKVKEAIAKRDLFWKEQMQIMAVEIQKAFDKYIKEQVITQSKLQGVLK